MKNPIKLKKLKRILKLRDLQNYLVSILVGGIVGVVCVLFRIIITFLEIKRFSFLTNSWSPFIRIPIYIIFTYIILLLIYRLILKHPLVAGNGAEQARGMLVGHIQHKHILRRLFQKFIASVGTLGIGMGLGREGPSIQFGSYIGIFFSKIFRITPGREENIIISGASAGVAAALNAPLAGPVYIMESLQKINNFRLGLCSLVGGLAGGLIASELFYDNPYKVMTLQRPDIENYVLLVIFCVMGLFMCIIGFSFTELVKLWRLRVDGNCKKVKVYLLIFAIYMGLISIYFPGLLGSGQHFMLNMAKQNNNIILISIIFLITFLFTGYSQATTFPGGAFFPLLTLGGISGKLFGALLVHYGYIEAVNVEYFLFIGMSAAFVLIMRTPLTGYLLVVEMTGQYEMLLPCLIVGNVGYLLISLIRTESLSHNLYHEILRLTHSLEKEQLDIYIEIMTNSYFEGKSTTDIILPFGCTLIKIERNHETLDVKDVPNLLAGDQLQIRTGNTEIEKVYQALICLSSDPD